MEAMTGPGFEIEQLPLQTIVSSNISLSDIVSALSFALDLTEGALPGHAVRTCLLGMRLADALGLSKEEKSDLYYALLLKDVGCSSNSAHLSEIIGGDDRKTKRAFKLLDWTRFSWPVLRATWVSVLPGASPIRKLRRLMQVSQQNKANQAEMVCLRAERGAKIVAKIGLSERAAESIRHLDEHWNGRGYPGKLRGENIPLGSRIVSIAQHLDVFYTAYGADAAMAMLRKRNWRWFDPRLVNLAASLHSKNDLWNSVGEAADRDRVLALDPGLAGNTTVVQIDNVCEAFADVVDAKSSFTYAHSMGVTRAATMIAEQLGLEPERQSLVYRAALLHDIGKLRVPNSILDKPGKLDAGEWKVIREHPLLTQRILERVTKFDLIARTASQHHERLDGSGYPHGLRGADLSIEARVIAVADVYGALSEDRPYRPALSADEIMAIMREDVPEKLDRTCFEALQRGLDRTGGAVRLANGQMLSGKRVAAKAHSFKKLASTSLDALSARAAALKARLWSGGMNSLTFTR